ncbi:MAG TPA: DNA-formamidopyrimidine glycosylase family protein [Polyangia bacterium]|nr:DNA-formamidopyrimidine glycosylase family protein [Polyangia bacterium]
MPELPEVEVAARNLRRWGVGHRVRSTAADPRAARIFRPAAARVLAQLRGARVDEVRRIGKNLLLTLKPAKRGRAAAQPLGVWSHLGMTGKWVRRRDDDPAPASRRLSLSLDDGSRLDYVDMRMFGRFRLVPGARFEDVPDLAALGPDPLADGVDPKRLFERLQRLRLPIKVALLDQTVLAGVGNIQASESLYRAKIDPRRPARSLSRPEVKRLAAGIRASIAFTLKSFGKAGADGDDADIAYVEENAPNPFLVYGRAGERCPRFKHADIVRIVQAQRGTYFCPKCQK